MTDLTRNIRSVAKQGNNIKAVVIAVSGERASVRLSINGAIYKTLKVVGGPVHVGQIVQVDFSSDIPYIVAVGTYTEPETFDYKARIPKYPTYVRSAVAGAEYAIVLYDMSAETLFNFPVDETGLTGAISAAASGDTIFIPPNTISGNFTIPDGVTVIGLDRDNCIISGCITLGSGSVLQNITVNNSGSGTVAAIKGPLALDTSAELLMVTAHAICSSGSGIGVMIQGGDVTVHYSSISGETSGSDGVGLGIAVIGVETEHYVEGDLVSYELQTYPSVESTEGIVERPHVPLTIHGGPDVNCLITDNGEVVYDLGAEYYIEHWMHYKKTEGDLYLHYSLDGENWYLAGHERISWATSGWGYGEVFGGATNFTARYLKYKVVGIILIGDRTWLGYFELLNSHATWYTWDNTGNSEVCWSHVYGTTLDLYAGNTQISVYAAQYDTYRTYGTLVLLDGDVRRQIAAQIMDITSQVPSGDGHYTVDYPINGDSISIYKNGLRQSPDTYVIDADGLGFTILFDLYEGDELVVDYAQMSYAIPEYTAMFYIDGFLEEVIYPMKIFNSSNRVKSIKKVFIGIGAYSTNEKIIVDVLIDGESIFASQGDCPFIWDFSYYGDSIAIGYPLWEVNSCLQVKILQKGTNASNLTVNVMYQ